MTEPIKIRGLRQNNLKNISLDIPKNKIVVLLSLLDTIYSILAAAECQ